MNQMVELIKQYRDCFAWDYHEMLGLARELVEHRVPTKDRYEPYKQPPQRFNPQLTSHIKAEI
jgi:hypothetical protein